MRSDSFSQTAGDDVKGTGHGKEGRRRIRSADRDEILRAPVISRQGV